MWPGITRTARVCLRFDDYHQSNRPGIWRETLTEYDERGLCGVIAIPPKYEGERLSADVVDFLCDLADSGWELAQHGYTHEPVGRGRGGPLYDDRSEFRGLALDEQERRIGAGRDILEAHGIEPKTFVPPWHEYDRTTARAAARQGFDCINEGRWLVPRRLEGVVLVPTHPPAITPETLAVGVVTLVGHPHLTSTPQDRLANARLLAGHERQVTTPSEIAAWWAQTPWSRRLGVPEIESWLQRQW